MKKLLLVLALPVILMLSAFQDTAAAPDPERKAVEQAVLNYVNGIYDVKPELIKASVHPDLAKYGFWRKQGATEYTGTAMTFEELVELAGKYNAAGKFPKDARREIEILDLMDQTACVKLTALWGVDTMQLAKFDGKWMIRNVMWQSHP